MHCEVRKANKVLVVDDERSVRELVCATLRSAGHEVLSAGDGQKALCIAHRFQPDIVLLDITLPLESGWLVAAKLKMLGDSPAIVFLSSGLNDEDHRLSRFLEGAAVWRKPLSAERVLEGMARLEREALTATKLAG
jgi:DNA-binding response OmpR family regulator